MSYAIQEDGGAVPHLYHRTPSDRLPGAWYVSKTGHRYPPGDIGPWDLGFPELNKAAAWAAKASA